MSAYLTTAEARALLKVSRGTLADMRKRGLIEAVNISEGKGRPTWRYKPESLCKIQSLEERLLTANLRRRAG